MADSGNGLLYYMNGLMLRLYPKAYLVEVRLADEPDMRQNTIEELPEWVLGSSRTIWLTLENAPIMRRAQHGEAMREALLRHAN